jgi:hypothetical protein
MGNLNIVHRYVKEMQIKSLLNHVFNLML